MTAQLNTSIIDVKPIPEGLPIPNRKVIRSWIEPFAEKQTIKAILLLLGDVLIWLALIAGVIFIENLFVKILLGNIAGFWIGRLLSWVTMPAIRAIRHIEN